MATRWATGLLVAAASTAAALAGCGGGHSGGAGGAGAGGAASGVSGRQVFAHACSSCHSLSGADNPRLQGGDLLRFHASRAQLTQLAAEMPVRHPLDGAQLAAVVRYVTGVEQRGSPSR
jgi:mono/diheme cytochrome c family protein